MVARMADRKYSEEEAKLKLDVIRHEYFNWFGVNLDDELLASLLRENLILAKKLFIKDIIGQNDVFQTHDLLQTLRPTAAKVPSDEQADTAGTPSEKGRRRNKRADKGDDDGGDVLSVAGPGISPEV